MIVVFSETKNRGTWKLFTWWRKGFSHVFVVDYDPDIDVWIKAECASEKMNFQFFKDDSADLLIGHLAENCTCVDARGDAKAIYFPRWLYCVSFVKHFLGIRKWWILTPYQLYCELRKDGHPLIFTETKEA